MEKEKKMELGTLKAILSEHEDTDTVEIRESENDWENVLVILGKEDSVTEVRF
jgi:hypothetical protein